MLLADKADDEQARGSFLSEAIIAGDLEHPNIVPIYDVGKDQAGDLFYSMKHVKGTPWIQVLGRTALSTNLEILMKVADAVAFAHSRGLIHRDLKPDNVMLGDFGEVLVMDWGLAIPVGAAIEIASVDGSPAYMAPEMALGEKERIGFATDIYLLGAILYEILTGHPPHEGETVTACLIAAALNHISPTEQTGKLLDIALKAMAADPEERYQNVGDFRDAIHEYGSHFGDQGTRHGTWGAGCWHQALAGEGIPKK